MCKLEQENMQKFRLHARAQVGVARDCGLPDRSLKDLPSRSIRIPGVLPRDCSLLLDNGDFELSGHMNPLLGNGDGRLDLESNGKQPALV
jgi:hypothetical protein